MKLLKFEKPILKYYAVGFTPLLIFLAVFELLEVSYFNFLFFIVTFCWNFTLRSPGLIERSGSLAYRFSFIKFICTYDGVLTKLPVCERNVYAKIFFRSLAPFSFVLFVSLLTGEGNLLYSVLAVVIFEAIYALAVKKDYISESSSLN